MSTTQVRRSNSFDSFFPTTTVSQSNNYSSAVQNAIQMTAAPPKTETQEVKPLETREVYKLMKPVICQIKTPSQEASGFFINQTGLLATTVHPFIIPSINKIDLTQIMDTVVKYLESEHHVQIFVPPCFYVKGVNVEKKQIQWISVNQPKGLDFETCWSNYLIKALKTDIILLQLVNHPETNCFDFCSDENLLEEGVDVYVGGYPMSLPNPTFHKGSISSRLKNADSVDQFTIDATIVAGNSGSPVVAQARGALFLIGVVFSEVADLDPEFVELEHGLNEARQKGGIGGMAVGMNIGGKVRSMNPFDLVSMSLTLIKRNMSTGIGRVINAAHILDFFQLHTDRIESFSNLLASYSFLPVGKTRKKKKEPALYIPTPGMVFYLHPDDHGMKHIMHSKKFDPKQKQTFIDNTKKSVRNWPATFYPDFANKYNEVLEAVIRKFADNEVSNPGNKENVFITFPGPVGADNGNETNTVELYYGAATGSHMRPKFR